MEAHELRIGNETVLGTVKYFFEEGGRLKCRLDSFSCEIEQLEPIPLDEEVLLAMGFEESAGYFEEDEDDEDRLDYEGTGEDPNRYFHKSNPENENWLFIQSSFVWENPMVVYASDSDGLPVSKKYSFVHEVQNLWFALTGKELIANKIESQK